MRPIFIEGVPGVGKITLAQKLCYKLSEIGYSTNYYLEFDFMNPIDFYCTAYFRQEEYESFLSEFPDYSDDIKCHTIIAEDIRLVRYYNGKTALFTEPLLNILRNLGICHIIHCDKKGYSFNHFFYGSDRGIYFEHDI